MARRVSQNDRSEVWAKEMEDGSQVVGLFNKGDSATQMTVRLEQVGIRGTAIIRDLRRREEVGSASGDIATNVSGHGCALLRLSV